MQEAAFYKPHPQGVRCLLCPKTCVLGEGQSGACRVRQNTGGKLITENYACCSGYALDSIEKKPLYHFYPGSRILSIGTWGCNFSCQFCQNWQIAQEKPETFELLPEKAVELAKSARNGNIGIAYTYSEPTVWYEYVRDTARLAKSTGLKNVLVTNGFINPEPLAELLPFFDAVNIDVKAFNPEFYRQICAGGLEPVKRTVELAVRQCHVEITTLLIPDKNDKAAEIEELAKWLAGLNTDIPLHLSRYFPRYKFHRPPTPLATLEAARRIAQAYLSYVYIGNMGHLGINTYCPSCGALVIDRETGRSLLTEDKLCPQCERSIAITGKVCLHSVS